MCLCDDKVDKLKKKLRNEIEQRIRRDPERIGGMLRLLSISRNLERIADCTANIAEDVIYMVDGRIVGIRPTDGGAKGGRHTSCAVRRKLKTAKTRGKGRRAAGTGTVPAT